VRIKRIRNAERSVREVEPDACAVRTVFAPRTLSAGAPSMTIRDYAAKIGTNLTGWAAPLGRRARNSRLTHFCSPCVPLCGLSRRKLLPPERLRLSRQPRTRIHLGTHINEMEGSCSPLGVFGHECSVRCVPTIGRVLPRARVRHDRGPAWKQNDHLERKCYLHQLGREDSNLRARRGQQMSQEGSLCSGYSFFALLPRLVQGFSCWAASG